MPQVVESVDGLGCPRAEFPGFDHGDRLVLSPDFVSVIVALLPIAPCGRSSF